MPSPFPLASMAARTSAARAAPHLLPLAEPSAAPLDACHAPRTRSSPHSATTRALAAASPTPNPPPLPWIGPERSGKNPNHFISNQKKKKKKTPIPSREEGRRRKGRRRSRARRTRTTDVGPDRSCAATPHRRRSPSSTPSNASGDVCARPALHGCDSSGLRPLPASPERPQP